MVITSTLEDVVISSRLIHIEAVAMLGLIEAKLQEAAVTLAEQLD